MPNPKHKTTKSKVGMRRSHDKPGSFQYTKCDKCGELKLAHNVCGACGSYKGRRVIMDKKEV